MYPLSVKVGSLGSYQGVLQSLGIITFQEFAIDRANSQTIFSNQLVCSIRESEYAFPPVCQGEAAFRGRSTERRVDLLPSLLYAGNLHP